MPTEAPTPVYPEPTTFPESLHETQPAVQSVPAPTTQILPVIIQSPPPSQAITVPDPIPHVEHSYKPEQLVCPRCGSSNLARGYVVDYSQRFQPIHFAPKRVKIGWLNSLFNFRPWRRLLKLSAEACRDCGAVTLVIDPEELRRAEHHRDF